jgi:predicted Zn-dependent protease
VEGFAFRGGRIIHPVREMLITGNMKELWKNLVAAGSDARECARWQIPTLAFEDVSFSA